MLIELSTH